MLLFQALCALVVYDLLCRMFHFETICSLIKNCKVRDCSAAGNAVSSACHAVNRACVIYPKRALCLQRAFVLTYLLRRLGIPAEMVLGAQKLPFKAHAWVEVHGVAINERSRVQDIYSIWERC